jgi:hypothetical protein
MFLLPDDDQLDAELEPHQDHHLDIEAMLKDTVWDFKFSQTTDLDPSDAHGV